MGAFASTHAVTEFRQAAFFEKPTQFPEASGLLGNLHSQHGLPLFPQFSALRNEAKTIEVHIGSAGNGHKLLTIQATPSNICFQAGDSESTGRFENGSCVLKDILNRRTDFIRTDCDDGIDVALDQPEGVLTDFAHGHTISE